MLNNMNKELVELLISPSNDGMIYDSKRVVIFDSIEKLLVDFINDNQNIFHLNILLMKDVLDGKNKDKNYKHLLLNGERYEFISKDGSITSRISGFLSKNDKYYVIKYPTEQNPSTSSFSIPLWNVAYFFCDLIKDGSIDSFIDWVFTDKNRVDVLKRGLTDIC